MLDPILRPLKDRLLGPVARLLGPRLHPTAITMLGFVAGVACAGTLLLGDATAALALWLANRALDGLDGLLARTTNRQTDLGGYLDILLDFIVYASVPIALSVSWPEAAGLPLATLLAAFYVNAASWMYLSALLEKRALGAVARGEVTSVTMPVGLIEGAETIILYSAFILFPDRLVILFWTMAGLLGVTVAQRLVWAMRSLRAVPSAGDPSRSATIGPGW